MTPIKSLVLLLVLVVCGAPLAAARLSQPRKGADVEREVASRRAGGHKLWEGDSCLDRNDCDCYDETGDYVDCRGDNYRNNERRYPRDFPRDRDNDRSSNRSDYDDKDPKDNKDPKGGKGGKGGVVRNLAAVGPVSGAPGEVGIWQYCPASLNACADGGAVTGLDCFASLQSDQIFVQLIIAGFWDAPSPPGNLGGVLLYNNEGVGRWKSAPVIVQLTAEGDPTFRFVATLGSSVRCAFQTPN